MSSPLRFLCTHCNQLIKIGHQMAGRTVACPQCGSRIAVPLVSDPAAEALYREQRARRAAEKAAGLVSPPSKRTLLGGIFSGRAHAPAPASATPEDDVDRWLDTLWSTPRETIDPVPGPMRPPVSTGTPEFPVIPAPPTVPLPAQPSYDFHSGTDSPTRHRSWDSAADEATSRCAELTEPVAKPPWSFLKTGWQRLAVLNLFVGFVLGIATHSEWVKFGNRPGKAAPVAESGMLTGTEDALSQSGILSCRGELLYRLADGTEMPDADAVVIFLPQDRPPTIPFSPLGLAPGQETRQTRKGAMSVEETGGAYVRTDAAGRFDAILSDSGHYLLVLISSHVCREETDAPSRDTLQSLRRFFSDPEKLLGPYQYACRDVSVSGATAPIIQRFDKDRRTP